MNFQVINNSGFSILFNCSGFVNWAKSNRIVVGPGRGSTGGSIVAYLSNITNVDPLKYNLLSKIFKSRKNIPSDIDLDFTDKEETKL